MTKTTPLFLGVNAFLFAGFAAASFAMPTQFASMLDINLTSPTALADFRAVYGGLSLAIAGFCFIGIRQPRVTLSAVWLLTLVMTGLILGRVVSSVVSGPGNFLIVAQLGLEAFACVWGALLIRASRAAQGAQLSSNTAAPAGA
ncbi:MAG: DUF4345 family protein [Archangium sp.]|nr:DUF4345 family protein [Archangium sp.]